MAVTGTQNRARRRAVATLRVGVAQWHPMGDVGATSNSTGTIAARGPKGGPLVFPSGDRRYQPRPGARVARAATGGVFRPSRSGAGLAVGLRLVENPPNTIQKLAFCDDASSCACIARCTCRLTACSKRGDCTPLANGARFRPRFGRMASCMRGPQHTVARHILCRSAERSSLQRRAVALPMSATAARERRRLAHSDRDVQSLSLMGLSPTASVRRRAGVRGLARRGSGRARRFEARSRSGCGGPRSMEEVRRSASATRLAKRTARHHDRRAERIQRRVAMRARVVNPAALG